VVDLVEFRSIYTENFYNGYVRYGGDLVRIDGGIDEEVTRISGISRIG